MFPCRPDCSGSKFIAREPHVRKSLKPEKDKAPGEGGYRSTRRLVIVCRGLLQGFNPESLDLVLPKNQKQCTDWDRHNQESFSPIGAELVQTNPVQDGDFDGLEVFEVHFECQVFSLPV